MSRRLVSLAATTLSITGLLVAVSGDADAAVTGVGRYTATTPERALDTRSGLGAPKHRVASGTTVTFALPTSVPSDATAVALNVTVTGSTASGFVTAYSGGTRPNASNVNYAARVTTANLALVSVDSSRKVSLYNAGSTVDLLADVSGYVRPGAAASGAAQALGGVQPLASARALDTRNATGVTTRTPVASGHTVSVKVAGSGTRLPGDASAVLVNLTATHATAGGFIAAYPTGAARPGTSNLNVLPGGTIAVLALVPIGNNGQITLYNGSSRPIDLIADVQGYVAGGSPVTTGAMGALVPQRVLDTRRTSAVGARGTTTLSLAGQGGVPRTGFADVLLSVTATQGGSSGFLTVYGAGESRPGTSNVNYAAGRSATGFAVARVDSAGRVSIYNGSPRSVQVIVDVAGYVTGTDVSVPATTRSRYLADLTGNASADASTMQTHGCDDAKLSPSLVLLDVGAQSRRSPELSKTNPGVALALSKNPGDTTMPVRLRYPALVAALQAYLDGFEDCRTGQAVRIAVGTSNDGNFHDASSSSNPPYPADSRGKDWAGRVVDALDPGTGISVVGATDTEAGFAGTEADAEAWTKAFLAGTTKKLIYNGSLDECGDGYSGTFTCRAPASAPWTPAQYVRLTYGLGPGRITVLPQIYFSLADQAAQWRNLYLASGKKLTFEGSLTQYGVCNSVACGFTGAQGWSALYHALSTVIDSPSLPAATDLVKS